MFFDIPLLCGFGGPTMQAYLQFTKTLSRVISSPLPHLFGPFKRVGSEWYSTDGQPTPTQTRQPQTIWLLFKQPV